MSNNFGLSIGVLIVLIALFFILREVVLWYWRVNHIVERLDSIVAELKKISQKE